MNQYRHKTLWTWISGHGGYKHFATEAETRSFALTYGGHGIYPPLYADD